MINKEQYDYYNKFRQVIELFNKTGQYVGGCNDLLDFMQVPDKQCPSCISAALIQAKQQIDEYERTMQSM